ncbi:hypothetical protein FGO68_gene12349 [Halteria grandinella]|uniref:Uncharacterized protein n=1 Tax=Halteria grandinella TaxID=5974 RepID=A0A8J8NR00_HALGN|nr:hypothetical protein FGO68_gene12349 [Halteria grandinella]
MIYNLQVIAPPQTLLCAAPERHEQQTLKKKVPSRKCGGILPKPVIREQTTQKLNLDLTLIVKRVVNTTMDVAQATQISEMADRAQVVSGEFDTFEEDFALNSHIHDEDPESEEQITVNHPLDLVINCGLTQSKQIQFPIEAKCIASTINYEERADQNGFDFKQGTFKLLNRQHFSQYMLKTEQQQIASSLQPSKQPLGLFGEAGYIMPIYGGQIILEELLEDEECHEPDKKTSRLIGEYGGDVLNLKTQEYKACPVQSLSEPPLLYQQLLENKQGALNNRIDLINNLNYGRNGSGQTGNYIQGQMREDNEEVEEIPDERENL